MIGTTISHYRIIEKLGAGGMGVVYRAEDLVLRRTVALKFLSPEIVADEERRARFQREARLAAALNHPNTCTVYEVGQVEAIDRGLAADDPLVPIGTPFIAMELVEGETLAARLARSGRLRTREVLDLAVQAAAGLAEAHVHRIVHRDLKPQNVMVTPAGRVKILDFGLAKPIAAIGRSETVLTTIDMISADLGEGSGVVVGTVAYMSPEQALGKPVGPRSDVFAFGTMLYELVAGRRPFRGDTPTAIVAKILEAEPAPLSAAAADVPPALMQIIQRCLQKRPEDRYQDAHDLAADLNEVRRRVSTGFPTSPAAPRLSSPAVDLTAPARPGRATATPESTSTMLRSRSIPSIAGAVALFLSLAAGWVFLDNFKNFKGHVIDSLAVLPLINASGDEDGEYLCDGITDSLIDSLSRLPGLRVMARSTVFSYKGKQVDPRKAGREMAVRAVFTGRMTHRNDTLSLGTELVNVADGSRLWGDQYNQKFSEVLALQPEIARQISEKLRLKLTGAQQQQLTKHYTENTEAYKLYLKGRYYPVNLYTADGFRKGIAYLNQAVALDPAYALAYAGLAATYYDASGAYLQPKDAMPKAKAAALNALQLDDTLAEAHNALAQVQAQYEWDWTEAGKHYRRALELSPSLAPAHLYYGAYLAHRGRLADGIEEITRARQLDPLTPLTGTYLALYYYAARQYDDAVSQCRKIIDMDPKFPLIHSVLGLVYEEQGLLTEALAEFNEAKRLDPQQPFTFGYLGHAYAMLGQRHKAQEMIEEIKQRANGSYNLDPFAVAIIYIGLKEKDQAFAWLEQAYQERSESLLWYKDTPLLDSLRSDPRLTDLMRRMNLSP
jgi:serine/threonine protein kinase/tetratricopeptide (TPR) repeat protein